MSVRELFNKRLGSTEVIPGDAFEKRLMRKLTRKEFVRFIPSKFNVYYLGVLVATGIVAGLLFSSNQSNNKEVQSNTINADSIILNDLKPVAILSSPEKAISIAKIDNKEIVLISSDSLKSSSEHSERTENKILATTDNEAVTAKLDVLLNDLEKNDGKLLSDMETANASIPLASFEMSSSTGCLPVKIEFYNKSVRYDSCSWTFGDGGTSNDNDPEWIFDEEGVYRIGLTVFNKNGLISVITGSLTINPRPQARFEISPEKVIIPGDEVHFINYSLNAVSYKWEFGDGNSSEEYNPVYRYAGYGKYNVSLIAKSEYGCTDTLLIENAFAGSAYDITFPNAFIPNSGGPTGGFYSSKSDEEAQVFHPVSSDVEEYQLRIFSKRGILIYESIDVNIGWDGYYKGQLSEPGVYIWKVRGKFNNGEPFVKMGDVILLKD
jgi:PKD repeat protein